LTAVPIYYDYRQVLASPLDLAVWIKQTLDVLELGPLVEGPEWERQLHELRLTAVWPDYILDFDRPEVNGPLWRKEALTTLVKAAPHRSPSIIRGASSMPSPSRVSPKVAGTAPLLSVRFQVTIVRSDNNEAESGASAPRRLAGTRFPLRDNPKSRSWLHPPIQVLMARRTTVANREHLTPLTGQSSAAVDVGAPRRATGVRDSEARLQALLSSLDDLVFELDEDGTYLGIWTGDDTLLAAPRSELLGRTVRELLGDDGRRLGRPAGQARLPVPSEQPRGARVWCVLRVPFLDYGTANSPARPSPFSSLPLSRSPSLRPRGCGPWPRPAGARP